MSYPTWSDLDNPSIVPPMGARRAPDIGPVAVMVSCEPDVRLIKSRIAISETHPFFISTLMRPSAPHGGISIAGPYIGAPYGVMLLDSLIAKGAKTVIVIGWCGALTAELAVGDIIVPDRAVVDEGTSANYKRLDEDIPVSFPHAGLSQSLSAHLRASGATPEKGTIWSTDAIYRETEQKVAHFKKMEACAVEMECSALFSVAEYRGARISAALIVSDSVASKDWKPGFRSKQFKKARQKVCESVMGFAKEISKQ